MSAAFTDNEIKTQGIDALIESLGEVEVEVEAERFISLNFTRTIRLCLVA